MKRKILSILDNLDILEPLQNGRDSLLRIISTLSWRISRKISFADSNILQQINEKGGCKLHLGCGKNIIPGWVNSDLYPKSQNILHLDASRRFPLNNGSCSAVFSEHMIEHITYPAALNLALESFRVLQPGGILRVSTPDLRFLLNLFAENPSQQSNSYIDFEIERNKAAIVREEGPTFVLNHFVRAWDHLFIHTEETLVALMERVGFVNIVKHDLNKSSVAELENLENEGRLPEGFLRLQTITIEGTKP